MGFSWMNVTAIFNARGAAVSIDGSVLTSEMKSAECFCSFLVNRVQSECTNGLYVEKESLEPSGWTNRTSVCVYRLNSKALMRD